ncbi:hypothetical protein MMC07_006858 [Pseudocyphellaria aurata]|nr:hypothetical protein [Pseudocyphellaria aurata]
MPSINSEIDSTEKHVPAWKKLGLKLKYAKDEFEVDIKNDQPFVQNEKKRNYVSDETSSPTESYPKKIKAKSSKNSDPVEHSPPQELSQLNDSSFSPPTSSAPATPAGPGSKRKSVTFTPDTKTEDGDSMKHLYNTWLASHRVVDPTFDPGATANSPALKIVLPPSVTPSSSSSPSAVPEVKRKTKKKKKSKSKSTLLKPKSESQQSQKTTQVSPSPMVKDDQIRSYLTIHHVSPSSWKFSKSRQNALLRSVFSLSTIPSSYNSALLSYLRGLQGPAAKSRVRKMALQARAEDEEWLKGLETSEKDKARRKADYDNAVERVRRMLKRKEELREERLADEECESRFQKRRRAEVVLWGIGEVEDDTSQPLSTGKNMEKAKDTNGGHGGAAVPGSTTVKAHTNLARNGKPKRKRKRKLRKTGVPDDDETSSSSSSSSSSSTLSSSLNDGGTPRALCDEETSSEESSSSSQDSSSEGIEQDGDSEGGSGSAHSSGDDSGSDTDTERQSESDESVTPPIAARSQALN